MRGKCYCDKTLRDVGEKVESDPTANNDYLWSFSMRGMIAM
jgi:hypothetical protein